MIKSLGNKSTPRKMGTFANYKSAEKSKTKDSDSFETVRNSKLLASEEARVARKLEHLESVFRSHRNTDADLASDSPNRVVLDSQSMLVEEVSSEISPGGFWSLFRPRASESKETTGPFYRKQNVSGVAEFDDNGRLIKLDAGVSRLSSGRDRFTLKTTQAGGVLQTYEDGYSRHKSEFLFADGICKAQGWLSEDVLPRPWG